MAASSTGERVIAVRGNVVVVSPTRVLCPGFVLTDEHGQISEIATSLDHLESPPTKVLEGDIVVPGFVDIHNHGMGGAADVLDYWSNPDHTLKLLAEQGTTSVLASLVFPEDSSQRIDAAFAAVDGACSVVKPGAAVLEGVHAEGPLITTRGGLPENNEYSTREAVEAIIERVPALKVMTISPSADAKMDYAAMTAVIQRGAVPALGHDKVATEEDILGALRLAGKLGSRVHCTHLYNVMSFHHRDPSLVNIGLLPSFPQLPRYEGCAEPSVEVIGDSFHVSAPAVQLAIAAKKATSGKVCFVTDAIAQSSPGFSAHYCGRPVRVAPDGMRVFAAESDTLVGSCAFVIDAFRRLVNDHGVELADAVGMCSTNPAAIAGIREAGTLNTGTRADMLLLDSKLGLQYTVVAGRVAHCNVTRVMVCGAGGEAQMGTGNLDDLHAPTPWPSGQPSAHIMCLSPSGLHGGMVTTQRKMYMWGTKNFGQIGDGEVTSSDVEVLPREIDLPGDVHARSVSAGWWHSAAIDHEGGVWAWGRNTNGQAGHEEIAEPVKLPQQVHLPVRAVNVSCGMKHTLVLGDDGRPYGFGCGKDGQLGSSVDKSSGVTCTAARPITGLGSMFIVQIAAGGAHSGFLTETGRVYMCGKGKNGQLGTGATESSRVPICVAGLPPVRKISVGWSHSLALSRFGVVYSWGRNDFGQVGSGGAEPVVPVATRITVGSTHEKVSDIACGAEHCVATTSTGEAYTWGWADHGQLGHGDTVDRREPTHLRGLDPVQQVHAGGAVTFFILK